MLLRGGILEQSSLWAPAPESSAAKTGWMKTAKMAVRWRSYRLVLSRTKVLRDLLIRWGFGWSVITLQPLRPPYDAVGTRASSHRLTVGPSALCWLGPIRPGV